MLVGVLGFLATPLRTNTSSSPAIRVRISEISLSPITREIVRVFPLKPDAATGVAYPIPCYNEWYRISSLRWSRVQAALVNAFLNAAGEPELDTSQPCRNTTQRCPGLWLCVQQWTSGDATVHQ